MPEPIAAPLRLSRDGAITAPTLAHHLEQRAGDAPQRVALAALVAALAQGSIPLAGRLAQGHLTGDPTAVVGTNDSGDRQKALDMAAHDHFVALLRGLSVARVLSEEAETVIDLDPEGLFDVAMDPIDGSGSIGIGAPLGALFAIFPAGGSFLRSGREMIGAAYVSFGHSVDFGFSMGDGVSIATLDPVTGIFHVDSVDVRVTDETSTVAFNASNRKRWLPGLQSYVLDLLEGADGPRGRDFNMRWIAAAVGDLHRILRRGGLFMYPADTRPGYGGGFLRLAYEAFPIAYLVEQAGGAASDGRRPILDRIPAHPHDRVPLVFGSRAEVAVVADYLSDPEHQET
ncbi:class 1 fructose-bisphosphatase [Roseivivax isoporae]|uniref:Fructose-1,6-bisphosphatase class 1 n=1 Tax=Roseivivax isoporae LMG 25204 TaxID=1449351 RepID=X7FDI8_9RHOB|nr:class 1 fructose-bisphosphatase [Roseivivax isoporae]ETX30828.1 fructose-1 6-bisphosphatase [Roseivivax isoporae LMG 25204]